MSNIHEVNVTDENLYLELWQYDAGQRLKFVETSIEDGSHVLFANSETRKAIRKEVANNEVGIPNKFLRATGKMHITIETFNENEETTLYEINGYIKRRQDGEPGTSPEDEPTFIQKIIRKTIELAQSVRDDADNGVFDGDDGYSPQVTVKTETPSTYVLHIKDADHEYDTPNLQGQGGEGSIEVGDGLKREGNVVSVDLKNGESVLGFDNGKLKSDLSAYYTKSESDNKYQNKLTVGNGIDISNDEISIGISSLSSNILDFESGKLWLNTNALPSDTGFRASMPYDEIIRQRLTEGNNSPLQPKLTAGTNITITDNVISASGGGLSYTFTDGLAESSGTVGIDLASGSKLLIDANDKLDVDLSSKQDVIDSNNMLDADLVDDSTSTNKFVSATDKQTWNAKADTTDIPTNVSELTNDSGYQTASDVASAISDKENKTTISTDTTSTTVSLTLADNHEYRYIQDLTSLTLTMPSGDFIASVVFASGSTPTSMTYDSSIKWSGDDVTSNAFVPQANMEYEIVFWYNGLSVNGVVRGVA